MRPFAVNSRKVAHARTKLSPPAARPMVVTRASPALHPASGSSSAPSEQSVPTAEPASAPAAVGQPSRPTSFAEQAIGQSGSTHVGQSGLVPRSSPGGCHLALLMQRITRVAPFCSPEELRAASRELAALALQSEAPIGPSSALPIARLPFTEQRSVEGGEVGELAADGDSVGSLEAGEEGDGSAVPSPAPSEAGGDGLTIFAPTVLGGVELAIPLGPEVHQYDAWDHTGWGPPTQAAFAFSTGAGQGDTAAADGARDDEEEDATSEVSESNVVLAGYRGAQDSIGLAEHGQFMVCDYCDMGIGTERDSCKAKNLFEARQVRVVAEKHERLRLRQPWADRDGREARHACYKATIRWEFATPLGAGNRVRVPKCCVVAIRERFPNPRCSCEADQENGEEACDFWVVCERRGHYTGFRTAEESRAFRLGEFVSSNVS